MIYKFNTASTANLNNFYNWLVEHKNDTFLNSVDIDFQEVDVNSHTITFSKNGVSIIFKSYDNTMGTAVTVIPAITYISDIVNKEWKTTNYSGNAVFLTGAVICNNGIILNIRSKISSSSYGTAYIRIVFDDNEDLSLILHSGNIVGNPNPTLVCALVSDSTDEPYCNVATHFNSLYTSLGHLVPESIGYKLISKHFIALYTQVASSGFYSVTFDGTNYITDGVHYIAD